MSEDAARMKALYSKLFDQYKKLKTKRLGDLETRHKDQELKFGTYIDAVEELIEHLRTQNERLNSQVKDLRYELALRSTAEEQCAQFEELLAEEKRKNEELSKEVESLQKVQLNNSKTSNGQPCTPASGQGAGKTGSRYSERLRSNKRRKHSESETEDILVPSSSCLDDEVQRHSEKHLQKEAVSGEALVNVQQTESCRTFERPGGCVNPIGVASSVCKVIAEYVLGLKISTNNETAENCVSAVHESSGYSFTLTWVQLAGMEDIFRYRVLSLGTLEKVAPDWMKDEAVFSGTMCRVFFERISYLVKQQS